MASGNHSNQAAEALPLKTLKSAPEAFSLSRASGAALETLTGFLLKD